MRRGIRGGRNRIEDAMIARIDRQRARAQARARRELARLFTLDEKKEKAA